MSERSKLNKLSRLELVELIYDIRKDNLSLEKQCRKLEKQLDELQAREADEAEGGSVQEHLDQIDERLDGLEDMLRDVRRYLTGRRSAAREAESGGRNQTWQE